MGPLPNGLFLAYKWGGDPNYSTTLDDPPSTVVIEGFSTSKCQESISSSSRLVSDLFQVVRSICFKRVGSNPPFAEIGFRSFKAVATDVPRPRDGLAPLVAM